MDIRKRLQSIRIGLKAGVKATDAMLKMVDQMQAGANRILDAAAEIKEMMPKDDEEEKGK